MASNVVAYTSYGCLLRNNRNPLYLDVIVMKGGHDFSLILSDLFETLEKYIKDYQVIVNHGDFVKFYNNTLIQVKLKNASDIHFFKDPQPFGGEEFEVVINAS